MERTKPNIKELAMTWALCAANIIVVLLLLGNKTVHATPWLKIALIIFILLSIAWFFLENKNDLKPGLKRWAQDAIKKQDPTVLFPGDSGYEEKLAELQSNKKLNA